MMKLADAIKARAARVLPGNPVRSRLEGAIASISFDDIPASAARVGAPILEAAGARGTFYMCGGHAGGAFEGRVQHDLADIRALHEAGHEIACHSFAHPNVARIDDVGRQADLVRNAGFVRDTLGDVQLSSFAYPYGAISPGAKRFYGRRFLTCRGVRWGLNADIADFADLRAIAVERRLHDRVRLREMIAKAVETRAWIIFFTHDVEAEPSPWGCTPDDLEDVLVALADAEVPVRPVKAAAAKVMFG
jgi:peptidoglycan/xylan/chitin deacetylase (PgdA/CDA1 family)